MNIKKYFFLLSVLLLSCCTSGVWAQTDTAGDNTDDLAKMLNDKSAASKAKPANYYVAATFKATRIINSQSIENTGKGVLDFRISHRFGEVTEGVKNLYGLDNATTRFGFDYGLTSWLTIGVGRSSFEKEYDGFFKVKLLRQTTDNHHPLSISYVGGISVQTMDVNNVPGYTYYFSNRLYYVDQLILARKFSKRFSLQLMPTYLHCNLATHINDPNDILAIGIGGRMKVSKRIAITGEYYYNLPDHKLTGYNNSLSVGIDIETGGHVFQIFVTNSSAITERTFIGETTGDPFKGDMHIGFNISRVFTVVHPKELRNN